MLYALLPFPYPSINGPLLFCLPEWENYRFPFRMQGIFMKSASRQVIFAAVAISGLTGVQNSPVSCFFVQLGQPVSFPRVG